MWLDLSDLPGLAAVFMFSDAIWITSTGTRVQLSISHSDHSTSVSASQLALFSTYSTIACACGGFLLSYFMVGVGQSSPWGLGSIQVFYPMGRQHFHLDSPSLGESGFCLLRRKIRLGSAFQGLDLPIPAIWHRNTANQFCFSSAWVQYLPLVSVTIHP